MRQPRTPAAAAQPKRGGEHESDGAGEDNIPRAIDVQAAKPERRRNDDQRRAMGQQFELSADPKHECLSNQCLEHRRDDKRLSRHSEWAGIS